jgi:hypothetical protein
MACFQNLPAVSWLISLELLWRHNVRSPLLPLLCHCYRALKHAHRHLERLALACVRSSDAAAAPAAATAAATQERSPSLKRTSIISHHRRSSVAHRYAGTASSTRRNSTLDRHLRRGEGNSDDDAASDSSQDSAAKEEAELQVSVWCASDRTTLFGVRTQTVRQSALFRCVPCVCASHHRADSLSNASGVCVRICAQQGMALAGDSDSDGNGNGGLSPRRRRVSAVALSPRSPRSPLSPRSPRQRRGSVGGGGGGDGTMGSGVGGRADGFWTSGRAWRSVAVRACDPRGWRAALRWQGR